MNAAVNVAPDDIKIRLTICQWALDAGQVDEAADQAKAAIQLAPKSAGANFFRGAVAMLEREYEGAEFYLETSSKLAPTNFPAKNNLVLALLQQDNKTKIHRALEYAEANLRQNPHSPDAAATYGWALYRNGRPDDAWQALRGAASIANTDVDAAYFTRGSRSTAAKRLRPGRCSKVR